MSINPWVRRRTEALAAKEVEAARAAWKDDPQIPDQILGVADDVVVVLLPDLAAAEAAVIDAGLDPATLREEKAQVRRLLATAHAPVPAADSRIAAQEQATEGPLSRREGSKQKAEDFQQRWSGVEGPEAKEVLAAVRQRAEDWRTGTAGVLGVITAALVISGIKDSIRLFDHDYVRAGLAALLVVAAALGLLSLRYAIRAANGPSWLDTKVKESVATPLSTAKRDLMRARAAANDLAKAQKLLWAAISVFVVLVACFWVTPYKFLM